jgi:hypothetical protein
MNLTKRTELRRLSPPAVVCRVGRNQECNRLRKVFSRSHDPAIRVYDEAGNVIETHEQAEEFKEW